LSYGRTTANITIYFIPSKPNLPWVVNRDGSNQNPWTDTLDMSLDWGVRNMTDPAEIATQITTYIYGSINFRYDILIFDNNGIIIDGGGRTLLSPGGVFVCTSFITKVKNKTTIKEKLMCY